MSAEGSNLKFQNSGVVDVGRAEALFPSPALHDRLDHLAGISVGHKENRLVEEIHLERINKIRGSCPYLRESLRSLRPQEVCDAFGLHDIFGRNKLPDISDQLAGHDAEIAFDELMFDKHLARSADLIRDDVGCFLRSLQRRAVNELNALVFELPAHDPGLILAKLGQGVVPPPVQNASGVIRVLPVANCDEFQNNTS